MDTEDVMATRRRWSDLDERTRRLLITTAVADGALRVAALIDAQSDLIHRPWASPSLPTTPFVPVPRRSSL